MSVIFSSLVASIMFIIGICSKCHGVKHIRNSQRLGYEKEVKEHFMKVNNCNEIEYVSYLTKAQIDIKFIDGK